MPKKLRHFLQRTKIQCRTNNYVGANIVRPLFHNIAVIYDIAVTHNIVVCDFEITENNDDIFNTIVKVTDVR